MSCGLCLQRCGWGAFQSHCMKLSGNFPPLSSTQDTHNAPTPHTHPHTHTHTHTPRRGGGVGGWTRERGVSGWGGVGWGGVGRKGKRFIRPRTQTCDAISTLVKQSGEDDTYRRQQRPADQNSRHHHHRRHHHHHQLNTAERLQGWSLRR